jgi:hypothetical protein
MAVSQVEHRLMRELLRVVRTRTSVEDDHFIRVNNMKVTNPAVGGTVDVPFDKLGEFKIILAEPEPPKLRSRVVHRHASLPLDRLHDWSTLLFVALQNEQIGRSSRGAFFLESWERNSTHRRMWMKVARTILDPNRNQIHTQYGSLSSPKTEKTLSNEVGPSEPTE